MIHLFQINRSAKEMFPDIPLSKCDRGYTLKPKFVQVFRNRMQLALSMSFGTLGMSHHAKLHLLKTFIYFT